MIINLKQFIYLWNLMRYLRDKFYLSFSVTGKISRLQYESPRTVLLKMLDGTAATLRTNFFNEDRYALSLRVRYSI